MVVILTSRLIFSTSYSLDIPVPAQGLDGIIRRPCWPPRCRNICRWSLPPEDPASPQSSRSAEFVQVGGTGFNANHIGNDQLVGVALLFGKGRSELNPLLGIGNDDLKGRYPRPRAPWPPPSPGYSRTPCWPGDALFPERRRRDFPPEQRHR